MDMLSNFSRSAACGAGALVITTLMSGSFVFSTATVALAFASPAPQVAAHAPARPRHFAFARSGPAVLVD